MTTPAAFRNALQIPVVGRGLQPLAKILAPFQRERFEAIDPSLQAVAAGEKPTMPRFFWTATKGGSKDFDLAVCLLWLLSVSTRPLLCQVGAADAAQAAELRKAAQTILHHNPWLAPMVTIQNWALVNPRTGSRAEIISADADSSHGARPDVLILNELTHLGDGGRNYAETLLDNASKVPGGIVVIATNAGWLDTWQLEWRDLARTSTRWSCHEFNEPAPWLDPAEIEEARRRNSPARFARLWKGVWGPRDAGDAIDPEDIEAACTLPGPMPHYMPEFAPMLAALDLGLKHDHSALVVAGLNVPRQRITIANVQSWRPPHAGGSIHLPDVELAVLSDVRRYQIDAVIYDPWQCEQMAQQLALCGVRMIPWPFTPKHADMMATQLLQVFRNRTIDIYRDERLMRDLGKLSIVERQQGFRLQAARDQYGHADVGMATAMLIPTAVGWLNQILFSPPDVDYDNPEIFRV